MCANGCHAVRLPDLPQPFAASERACADLCHSLRERDRRQQVSVLKRPFANPGDTVGKPESGDIPRTFPEHTVLIRLKTVEAVRHRLHCQRRKLPLAVCQPGEPHCHPVRQCHLPQVDTVAERVFFDLHTLAPPALSTHVRKADLCDIQPVCKRPAAHQTDIRRNHNLPRTGRAVQQHIAHHCQGRLSAHICQPGCPVKSPRADVRHALRDLHLHKHHRIAEHLRADLSYPCGNPHRSCRSPVADQIRLLLDGKTAERTVKQEPRRLRDLLRKKIRITFKRPLFSLQCHPPQRGTARERVLIQPDHTPLPGQTDRL